MGINHQQHILLKLFCYPFTTLLLNIFFEEFRSMSLNLLFQKFIEAGKEI